MVITFNCPHCNAELKAPDKFAGRSGRCKYCQTMVRIPAAPEMPADGALLDSVAEEQRENEQPAPPSPKGIEVACPNCRKHFHVDLQGAAPSGSIRVMCDHCGVTKRLSAFQKELGRQVRQTEQEKERDKAKTGEQLRRQLDMWEEQKRQAVPVAPVVTVVTDQGNTNTSEALGWLLVIVPIITTALIWFWIGNMNLFQNPSQNLWLVGGATVLLTAILMGVEASMLGMGRRRLVNNTRGTLPVMWVFAGVLLWIVAYPCYLHQRSKYGVGNRVVLGLLSAALFFGSFCIMNAAIEGHKQEVRNSLSGLAGALQGNHDTFGLTSSRVDSPAANTAKPGPRVHKMRETVSVGYTSYVVWRATWQDSIGTGFTRQQPNASFLVLNITVRNNDDTARTVPPLKLIDENGAEYSESTAGLGDEWFSAIENLNPGVSKQGNIAFDSPKGHSYQLNVSGGFWSDETALIEIVAD